MHYNTLLPLFYSLMFRKRIDEFSANSVMKKKVAVNTKRQKEMNFILKKKGEEVQRKIL